MSVGVVIITYNNEDHIGLAIQSLRDQTREDWTAVLIDNGSTDTTFEVMQRLVEGDARFIAFKKLNEGPAAGRNLGFSKLSDTHEFLHFLDGDDALHPAFLEKMTGYLITHPKVGMVACQFDEIDKDGSYIGKGHRSRFAPTKLGLPHDIPKSIHATPFVAFFSSTAQGPFCVYRRSVYLKTNGFELASQEDTDMYCKMALLAEVHYIPDYFYIKRRHPGNLAHNKKYKATHRVFRNKWDTYQSSDPKVNRLIQESLKYYYTRHKPLRDLKVSAKAFRIFIRKADLHSLRWSMECLGAGLSDLVLQKSYRRVMNARKKA